jgi:hypothetical protein
MASVKPKPKRFVMKVIIQDTDTGKYLAVNEAWTDNVSLARDFRNRPRSFEALRSERPRGVRVVYYFEDLDYSIGARNWKDHGWANLCAAA